MKCSRGPNMGSNERKSSYFFLIIVLLSTFCGRMSRIMALTALTANNLSKTVADALSTTPFFCLKMMPAIFIRVQTPTGYGGYSLDEAGYHFSVFHLIDKLVTHPWPHNTCQTHKRTLKKINMHSCLVSLRSPLFGNSRFLSWTMLLDLLNCLKVISFVYMCWNKSACTGVSCDITVAHMCVLYRWRKWLRNHFCSLRFS